MTTTPESWDDVGHLRLQVDCISQKVEHHDRELDDFQTRIVLELQKMKDEVALMHAQEQEQKKETCRWKVGTIITTILFGCALAMHVFTHRKSGDVGKKHLDDAIASEVTVPVPATDANNDTQRIIKNALQQKQKSGREVHGVQHPQSSSEDEESDQNVASSPQDDARDIREDTGDEKDKDVDAGVDHEDAEQPTEISVDADSLSPPIDPSADVLAGSLDEGRQEVINATEVNPSSLLDHMRGLPPLPFQIMSKKVLERSIHGVFWVCFPPSTMKQHVKKYASVFNEVAQSQKWRIYPFCYLDTRDLDNKYKQHGCNDIDKITFVMNKPQGAYSWKAKRVFPPDQNIQASLVEDFLNDVHKGKLREVMTNGDGDL